jgi:hypothetical protein
MLLSTIFQIYHGGQFYWKPEYQEKTVMVNNSSNINNNMYTLHNKVHLLSYTYHVHQLQLKLLVLINNKNAYISKHIRSINQQMGKEKNISQIVTYISTISA